MQACRKKKSQASPTAAEAKARGGQARAKNLTPRRRQEIARNAAISRWDAELPTAGYEGEVHIGEQALAAYVLPNGKRLISQGTLLMALGRSRTPKAGTGALSVTDERLPSFLQAEGLQEFISPQLREITTPIFFRSASGAKRVGYDAELLPRVCEVYLRFRDSFLNNKSEVPSQYRHIVAACDMLMRGLAHVGIAALVDEATGYQRIRDQDALQAILETFIRKELAAWVKTFPEEFYREIYRLRGWEWRGMHVNRYSVVAKYTTNLVYERLAPGLIRELEERNPKTEKGYRKSKHFQWLTEDVGHPALAQHLHALIAFMRASNSWDQFKKMVDKAFPKRGDSLALPSSK